jgi:tetratricopeptide (TPR) repeat protein
MKKFLSFFVFTFLAYTVSAQENDALKTHYLKVYRQALAYNDASAAINALQNYIASENNTAYKDTLSMLYFNVKSYYSALLISEEVFKEAPGNLDAIARAAECYDELGDPKTAIGLFEQVVPKTKNPYHIYKLGVCQYQLKRSAESEASAKAVLADTNSKKMGVNFTMAEGNLQLVPINAAAANLLGVLQMDVKNYVQAKTFFEKALSLFPQFAGAKENMNICDKNLKSGIKTPAKPQTKPKGQ